MCSRRRRHLHCIKEAGEDVARIAEHDLDVEALRLLHYLLHIPGPPQVHTNLQILHSWQAGRTGAHKGQEQLPSKLCCPELLPQSRLPMDQAK